MASEIEELRQEIELLKDTMSEMITEHNHMTLYIEELRNKLQSHLMFKWYRFIVWMWPMPLPLYRRRVVVNRFRKRDRRPVLRTAPQRDRVPRAGA
jgi:hypothetical protein